MKKIFIIFTLFLLLITSCLNLETKKETIYQYSTINALLEGMYDGEMTIKDLKSSGNFGIGTFNGLDGEMILLDKNVYKIKSDGIAYKANDSDMTPFAAVTTFNADKTINISEEIDYEKLKDLLDKSIKSENKLYAIKITGVFKYMKTRSVPKQNKPYPKLIEVVKHQPEFEFYNIEGTIVGFKLPQYINGINVPGYHFHFLTKDNKAGGHILALTTQKVKIGIDYTANIFLILPETEEFENVDLKKDNKKNLKEIEE